jgi:hypothetical protein
MAMIGCAFFHYLLGEAKHLLITAYYTADHCHCLDKQWQWSAV